MGVISEVVKAVGSGAGALASALGKVAVEGAKIGASTAKVTGECVVKGAAQGAGAAIKTVLK